MILFDEVQPVFNLCPACGDPVYKHIGGYKCTNPKCGCMSFPVEVGDIKIDETIITFEPYVTLNPIF